MIELEGLTKSFPGADGRPKPAVEDVSFSVRPGEVFGLLGPNGAGKTTTLRMLCTVLRPTAGFATVAGFDVVANPADVRRSIGFLSANTGVYDRMTAWEMVEYYGRLAGMNGANLRERMDHLFDAFQMAEFKDVVGGRLSTGMRQKVSIARALVHDPPVLIFDEPTAGLDILVQRAVIQRIAALRAEGKTILFSTHHFTEVQKVCDRVAIIARGRLLVQGTLAELTAAHGGDSLEEVFFGLVEQPANGAT